MAKTVSLVLGSGGARGYAHIGVIDALVKRGYDIVSITGCSMGALVGGLYAAGKLDDYRDWVTQLSSVDILRLLDVSLVSPGLIRGDKVFAVINDLIGDLKIEDLPISYTAVATDIVSQKEVWFQHGNLQTAMRASIAIPSLFSPVIQGNRILVDGGVLNPLPIAPSVSAHADYIIAVDVSAEPNRCIAVTPDTEELAEELTAATEKMDADPEARQTSKSVQHPVEALPKLTVDDECLGAEAFYDGDVAVSEEVQVARKGTKTAFSAFNGSQRSHYRNESDIGDGESSADCDDDATMGMSGGGSFDSWVNVFRHRAFQYFDRGAPNEGLRGEEDAESSVQDIKGNESRLGFLSMINQAFETMQGALTQYKIAGYPPDLLIEVPKTACRIYEFHKAQGLIDQGSELTHKALDRLEARQLDKL